MFTFTEPRIWCTESVFLKYIGYFLPLLLFLLVKHVSQRFASKPNKIEVIGANIQTDSINDPNDEVYKPHLPEREHVPYRGLTVCLDQSGDHFYRMANDRRSIRKFAKDKPVDLSVIEKCILAAGEISKRKIFI